MPVGGSGVQIFLMPSLGYKGAKIKPQGTSQGVYILRFLARLPLLSAVQIPSDCLLNYFQVIVMFRGTGNTSQLVVEPETYVDF